MRRDFVKMFVTCFFRRSRMVFISILELCAFANSHPTVDADPYLESTHIQADTFAFGKVAKSFVYVKYYCICFFPVKSHLLRVFFTVLRIIIIIIINICSASITN